MFIRKVKYRSQSTSASFPRTTSRPTISTPLSVYPKGIIDTYIPYFSWLSVANTEMYHLWVNDNGIPHIEGRIIEYYTPIEAGCHLNDDQFCRVTPSIQFTEYGGQWWVTAFFNKIQTILNIVDGLSFTIE